MKGESRWAVDYEIPTMETDSAAPMTTKEAEDMWRRYLANHPSQIERFRHCLGCVHLRQAGGSYLVCCYLLLTGKKRPCVFGTPCPVKVIPDNFHLPDGYDEWCAGLDEKETAGKKKKGKLGREAQWDTEYGKALFDRGFAPSEICQIMGISQHTFSGYATQHMWNYNEDGSKRKKTFPHATREMIDAEREAFLRHQSGTEGA